MLLPVVFALVFLGLIIEMCMGGAWGFAAVLALVGAWFFPIYIADVRRDSK